MSSLLKQLQFEHTMFSQEYMFHVTKNYSDSRPDKHAISRKTFHDRSWILLRESRLYKYHYTIFLKQYNGFVNMFKPEWAPFQYLFPEN